jgi:TonB family protein
MSRAPHNEPQEFASLLSWQEPVTPARLSRAAIASIAFHVVALLVFLLLPKSDYKYRDSIRVNFEGREAVKIYAPRPQELTQKDPNKGKVTHELDVRSALEAKPAPRIFQPPAPTGPPNRPPSPTPALSAPNVEVVVNAPEIAGLTGVPNLPRPQDQPKLSLENVPPAPVGNPSPNPTLRAPKATPGEMAKSSKPGGGGGGVFSDGDNGDPTSVGNMQLLSDPQNIDFKPYMLQVLNLVRRQWFAVIPQIARTGRQGIVVLQFSIDRRGQVPKLVIANTSGTPAFDQAAVASVSASNPFPTLPNDYRGTEIRLQLAFSYNVPRVR